MHDTNMATAAAKELVDFHAKTGEWAWWTNSMFGGMPGFMIAGEYPFSFISYVGVALSSILPSPANVIFLLMFGFYILMYTTKQPSWLAILGSLAYAFGTYNLLFTEAGHLSKILALAYAPVVLAGFVLVFDRKYLVGTLLTTLGLGLELYANHLQITYYLFFILLVYSGFKLVALFNEKRKNDLPRIVLSFTVALLIGVGSHGMRLWNNLTYSAETMRGTSELSKTTAGKNGLDVTYAFGWSYGISETMTLIVPNLMGGGSVGALSESSATYKALVGGGVQPQDAAQFTKQLPLYTGTQPSTSGPAYSGVIIVFLFLLGLFIRKDSLKWGELGLVILFIVWSWGSNFADFNTFSFEFIPGFNKFRAITMLLTLVHFLFVWGAVQTLHYLFSSEISWPTIRKKAYYTVAILVGFMFLGYVSQTFSSSNDVAMQQSLSQSLGPDFASNIIQALREDRGGLARMDVLRSIILVFLSLGLLWANAAKKLKQAYIAYLLVGLVVFDLLFVGKRYFNNDDFIPKYQLSSTFEPSPADTQILQDTTHYRVVNLTTSFWQDARDSYFHNSIGGYHGAKLKRMQELFEQQMVPNGQLNMSVFNMLNTKYFITQNQQGALEPQFNPEAYGNAWFVDSLQFVSSPDEELGALSKVNLDNTAILLASTAKDLNLKNAYPADSTRKVELVSYTPNKLVYKTSSKTPGFLVFSEIFYRGNQDWVSYIDGNTQPHVKVNYVLRGISVEAGEHDITFEFKPASVYKGKYIDLASSLALIFLLLGVFWKARKEKK